MRCGGPAVQAAPLLACPIRTPGAVTAGRRTVLPSQECRRMPGPKDGGVVTQQVSPSRGGADHRGGCGASLKHRARDALGLADLRHEQTLRQASMSRGVEARGSFWTPGVPRALGSSSGRCGFSRTRRRTGRRKETGWWCLSGANRQARRALLWLAIVFIRSFRGASESERIRNPERNAVRASGFRVRRRTRRRRV